MQLLHCDAHIRTIYQANKHNAICTPPHITEDLVVDVFVRETSIIQEMRNDRPVLCEGGRRRVGKARKGFGAILEAVIQ